MSRYVKHVVGVFVLALMISAMQSMPAKAGSGGLPHEGEDPFKCLCFGRFFNGFNATGVQPNGQCARSQTGPYCFVLEEFMPLHWKVQEMRTCDNNFYIGLGRSNNCDLQCPPGKMVLSCNGFVEPDLWYYTYSRVFPHPSGLGCVHEISIARRGMDAATEGGFFDAKTWAICAAPAMEGAPSPR